MRHIVPPYLKNAVTGAGARRISKRKPSKRIRQSKSPQFLSTIKQLNITD